MLNKWRFMAILHFITRSRGLKNTGKNGKSGNVKYSVYLSYGYVVFMFPGLSRYFPFLSAATCQPDAMQSPLSSPFARENPLPRCYRQRRKGLVEITTPYPPERNGEAV
ncbi:hypothetical protein EJW09_11060 [Salmonella enterica subsp. enterica serovar Braenderup]|nr:hypothetical protein [Salmonella enterica subsp. enterica serovar Braenderup]